MSGTEFPYAGPKRTARFSMTRRKSDPGKGGGESPTDDSNSGDEAQSAAPAPADEVD
jgi:hypothetical protein